AAISILPCTASAEEIHLHCEVGPGRAQQQVHIDFANSTVRTNFGGPYRAKITADRIDWTESGLRGYPIYKTINRWTGGLISNNSDPGGFVMEMQCRKLDAPVIR